MTHAPTVLVVLGCRVTGGHPSGALTRRLSRALAAHRQWPKTPIIVCGGKRWEGRTESSVMAQWLLDHGVAPELITRESRSTSTRENASEARVLLGMPRGTSERVGLVTCDYHMTRATHVFQQQGFRVLRLAVSSPRNGWPHKRQVAREWVAARAESLRQLTVFRAIGFLLALLPLSGCQPDVLRETKDDAGTSRLSPPSAPIADQDVDPMLLRARRLARATPLPGNRQEPPSQTNHASKTGDSSQEHPRNQVASPGPARGPIQKQDDSHELARLLLANKEAARWAAMGLGRRCSPHTPEIELQLIAATAGWASSASPPDAELLSTAAWALGRCGTRRAESTLRGWLNPPPQIAFDQLVAAASVGLGATADSRGRLSERTQTALLDAAARQHDPFLLYPLGRLPRLGDAVGARLLDIAGDLLVAEATPARLQVVLALGSAGAQAAAPLGQILLTDRYLPAERSAAAIALGRLASEGQRQLDQTLRELLERGLPMEATSSRWIPLRSALTELQIVRNSKTTLRELSTVVLPEGDDQAAQMQRRRLIWLRCRAADLLAGSRSKSQTLSRCDPDQGSEFALAQLRVLDRAPLEGQRQTVYREHMKNEDPRVVQAAIRLLAAHPEVDDSAELLVQALQRESAGVQATAFQVIAAYPARAQKEGEAEGHDRRILAHLKTTLTEKVPITPPETLAAAIAAAGALGGLTLKPPIEQLCKSGRPSLRSHAQRALALLGSPKRVCGVAQDEWDSASEKLMGSSAGAAPLTLEFDSDVGLLKLHLDEPQTARSRAHLSRLIQGGFYDGQRVQGAKPGLAVQFGDPDGDGFDDVSHPFLGVELTPTPFNEGSVGMSAFALGEQNTQLFVTLAAAPQLTANKQRIGRIDGPWELLVPGDSLGKVRLARTLP